MRRRSQAGVTTVELIITMAITAIVLARVDGYVEGSDHRDAVTGRAWRAYRARSGKKPKRGTPPDAGGAIDTQGKPQP
jgi:hypothetical protein